MVYMLTSENLTHLGGPMGSEYTYPNWSKLFGTLEAAKLYAEADYEVQAKKKADWEWVKEGQGLRSPDLIAMMYHIRKERVNT
jgi:hypothetical protein